MRNTGIVLAALLGVQAWAYAEDKKEVDAGKIVGIWKVTKAEGAPEGALVEFTKDGKIVLTFEMEGKKFKFDGTYKVEGDKLLTVVKIGENEQKDSDTIKTLTDQKLVLIDKDGKASEFEKTKK